MSAYAGPMDATPGIPADPPGQASANQPGDGAPGRRLLLADDRPVLAFTPYQQQEPTAEDAEPLADLAVVVPAVLAQLPGWWLTSPDPALLDALLAAGARLVRHAHLYSRPLSPADAHLGAGGFLGAGTPAAAGPDAPTPAPPRADLGALRIGPISRSAGELATVSALAYGPGHVDHMAGGVAEEEVDLALLLDGGLVGPLISHASFEATSGGALVGAILVNRSPGEPPAGGPWLSQVFRHPDPAWAGLGGHLVERAVAALAAAGEPALGLAVTDGNPAERVYRRLGFVRQASRRKLALPG